MSSFGIKRNIPSCNIEINTMKLIESYFKDQLYKHIPDPDKEDVRINFTYKIIISDGMGQETLGSVEKLKTDIFLDSIKEIKMQFSRGISFRDRAISVNIRFHIDRMFSEYSIDVTGDNSREIAVGLEDGLKRILLQARNQNVIFHPYPVLTALIAGTFITSLMFNILTFLRDSTIIPWNLILLLLLIYYFISAYLLPYIVFNTRKNQRNYSVWKWFTVGAVGFSLFGTVFPLIRKSILGF